MIVCVRAYYTRFLFLVQSRKCTYRYTSYIIMFMAIPKFTITEEDQQRYVHILRGGDSYDFAFAEYHVGEQGRLVSKMLNEKKLTIKDTDQTYRLINHWSSLGLIADTRKGEGEWRKLSILDVVWIHVLVVLRGFGLPHEKLRMTQKTLFARGSQTAMCPFFEFAVAQVLMKREQCLIVFPDGKAAAIDGGLVEVNRQAFKIDDHICINLNRLASRLFKDKDFSPPYRANVRLSDEEADMLLQMRSGNYESVTVKMKDGHIEMIESTETIEAQTRLVEILQDAAYQDIEVKTKEGKVVSIKRTVKQKTASKATERIRASSTEPLQSSDKPKLNAVRYAEAHHKSELAKTKIDNPNDMICVCPTCHKVIHFGSEEELTRRYN